MKRIVAAIFLVLGITGVLSALAPSASAQIVCVDPYVKVFGNVLLNDEICL